MPSFKTDDELVALLANQHNEMQKRLLKLEVAQRVDQDLIHCALLVLDNPDGLRKIWEMAASAIAADGGMRLAFLDHQEEELVQLIKSEMADRLDFWRERIQSAIELRQDDDDSD